MSAVAAPSDRRFRRAHVKRSRPRRRWRGRVKPLLGYVPVALFVAYGLYIVADGLRQAQVLRVNRIAIRGNERLSEGDVLAVLGGLRGESLVWTDLDRWRDRLLASPWVSDATLRRSLPSTIEIVVREREPIGVARLRDHMYLVDERGEIIDGYGPQYSDLDLPIIDGLVAAGPAAGTLTDRARAELAARLVTALKVNPGLAASVSQIDVSDLHNVQVILSGDPAIISLGEAQFLERLESYLDFAATLRERIADIDHVDVRFENRIYVRPAPKQGARKR
jgi:cell division protein FtsQ